MPVISNATQARLQKKTKQGTKAQTALAPGQTPQTPGPAGPPGPLAQKTQQNAINLPVFDAAGERTVQNQEIERQAEQSRQRLARSFALTPGGLRQGEGQTQFELFEGEVLGAKNQAALDISRRAGEEQRATVATQAGTVGQLTQAEVQRGQLGLSQAELAERTRAAQAQEEFQAAGLTGDFRNANTEAKEARLFQQSVAEAGLTGKFNDKLTLDAALARAQASGDFLDPVTGVDAPTLQKLQQNFQQKLATSQVTGTFDEDDTIELRRQKLSEAIARAEQSGNFFDPVTGIDGPTLRQEQFDFEQKVAEAGLTGTFNEQATEQAKLQRLQEAVTIAQQTGSFVNPNDPNTTVETVQAEIQRGQLDLQREQERQGAFEFLTTQLGVVGGAGPVSAAQLGINVAGIFAPDGTLANPDQYRLAQDQIRASALNRELTAGQVTTLLSGGTVNVDARPTLAAQDQSIRSSVALTQQQVATKQQQLAEVNAKMERAIAQGNTTGVFTDPVTKEPFATLSQQQLALQQEIERGTLDLNVTSQQFQQRVQQGQITGNFINQISAADIGLDLTGIYREDGTIDLAQRNALVDQVNANFQTIAGREATGVEIQQMLAGNPVALKVEDTLAKTLQENEKKLAIAQLTGDYEEEATLQQQQLNLQQRLGLMEATGAVYDENGDLVLDDEGNTLTTLDQQRLDLEARLREAELVGDLDGKATIQQELATLQGEIQRGQQSLQRIELFGGTQGLSLASFGLDPDVVTGYFDAEGNIDLTREFTLTGAGLDQFSPDAAIREAFSAEFGRPPAVSEVATLRSRGAVRAQSEQAQKELWATFTAIQEGLANATGREATAEEVMDVMLGGTVGERKTLAAREAKENRLLEEDRIANQATQITNQATQFTQGQRLERELAAGLVNIGGRTTETLGRLQFEETARQFDAQIDAQVAEAAARIGLDAQQQEIVKTELNHRILTETRELSAQISQNWASITGQAGGSGSVSAADLGVDISTLDPGAGAEGQLDTPEVQSMIASFEAMTGQTPTLAELTDLIRGETVTSDTVPTLQARELASTITQQNMERMLKYQAIAAENGLEVNRFEQAKKQADQAWNLTSLNMGAAVGMNESQAQQFRVFKYQLDARLAEAGDAGNIDAITSQVALEFQNTTGLSTGKFMQANDLFDQAYGTERDRIAVQNGMQAEQFRRANSQADFQESQLEQIWGSLLASRASSQVVIQPDRVSDPTLQAGLLSLKNSVELDPAVDADLRDRFSREFNVALSPEDWANVKTRVALSSTTGTLPSSQFFTANQLTEISSVYEAFASLNTDFGRARLKDLRKNINERYALNITSDEELGALAAGTLAIEGSEEFVNLNLPPRDWLTRMDGEQMQSIFALINGGNISPERQSASGWAQLGGIIGNIATAFVGRPTG